MAAYTLELEGNGFFDQSQITANGQRVVQSRHNRNFGSNSLKNRTEEVTIFGLNADFEKRIAKHELRYGLELTRDAVTSSAFSEYIVTGAVSYLGTRYPGSSTMTHAAAYLTHTVELNRRWLLSEGVRLSHVGLRSTFSDAEDFQFLNGTVAQDNTAFNWRAGAVWSPGKAWRVTALASTGFRAPNVDDLGKVFDSTPVSYTHLPAHETVLDILCRLLLEKKKNHLTQRASHFHVPHQNLTYHVNRPAVHL